MQAEDGRAVLDNFLYVCRYMDSLQDYGVAVMGMREKLIELLTAPISITESVLGEEATPKMQMGRIFAEILADHLIANGVTIPVRCKDCKYGIWNEEEQMWQCVYSAELDEGIGEYFGFFEYNEGEHFCSRGERRTDV